jgi:plastocyanin
MRRGMLFMTLGVATIVLGMPGAALAGGGCHSPVTSNDASGGGRATVRMIDACFKASLTTVDPGTAVTFVNEDWTAHNVGGNEWGNLEDMREDDAFTATFTDPGIYPFACSYHPGMTGAIVVGDGTGAGNGDAVSVEPFQQAPPAVAPAAAQDDGIPMVPLVGVGLSGIAIGAGIALAAGRKRPA